eukprot:TRINITY_DN1680_c0_g1_i1.p2 TRINITY_DN1680_c0_g1~~TRINITY_DN1680_c0_g1_i1.p2  ORF type:complete len:113 (-),score=27.57 TRINITY_DN1680_c0_g1_i1:285-623(-)
MRFLLCLVLCLLLASVAVWGDDLRDLSTSDEPISLDDASSSLPVAQEAQHKEPRLGEGEEFGFQGVMTTGSFMMRSTRFEQDEELGEDEDWGFGGFMTSGSFMMVPSTRWDE